MGISFGLRASRLTTSPISSPLADITGARRTTARTRLMTLTELSARAVLGLVSLGVACGVEAQSKRNVSQAAYVAAIPGSALGCLISADLPHAVAARRTGAHRFERLTKKQLQRLARKASKQRARQILNLPSTCMAVTAQRAAITPATSGLKKDPSESEIQRLETDISQGEQHSEKPARRFAEYQLPSTEQSTCFDGADNNGDGVADSGNGDLRNADFGCFGPNATESITASGYHLFYPSNDSRIIFVSSSEGNDANSGLSALSPKRTIAAGYSLLRNGYPDWILLKRGDTFDGSDPLQRFGESPSSSEGDYLFLRSGRSSQELMVISSYGASSARPVILVDNAFTNTSVTTRPGIRLWNQSYIAINGLDFYAVSCDPSHARFRHLGCDSGAKLQYNNSNILIQDNVFRFFGTGVEVTNTEAGAAWDQIRIHRNVIRDSYHTIAHSQGIYTSGAGMLRISDNLLYHNGWNEEFRMTVRPAAFNQSAWRAVTAGAVNVRLNGTDYTLTELNFSSVSSYHDVAAILEGALRQAAGASAQISIRFVGSSLVLRSALPSSELYTMTSVAGLAPSQDLASPALLDFKLKNPSHAAATKYNRNMYLAHGYSNTVVDGNITIAGASGGIQARMGGVVRDNLTVNEPVGISVGHAENPSGIPVYAHLHDNFVSGAADIGVTGRGFGLGIAGQTFVVERNIIANNQFGTGEIEGIFSDTDRDISTRNLAYTHGIVKDNIVYNWKSPLSGGGAAVSFRHDRFENVLLERNELIQPFGGTILGYFTTAPLVGVLFGENTIHAGNLPSGSQMFTVAQVPMTLASFSAQAGGGWTQRLPNYAAPERTFERYLAERLPSIGTIKDFVDEYTSQSRASRSNVFSREAIMNYLREGFELADS